MKALWLISQKFLNFLLVCFGSSLLLPAKNSGPELADRRYGFRLRHVSIPSSHLLRNV